MSEEPEKTERTISLTVDEDDYRAIHSAIARRQTWRCLPEDEGGNLAGRVLAEICRGWEELHDHLDRSG